VNPVTIEVPLQQVTEGKLAKKKKTEIENHCQYCAAVFASF